jgi:hypothetical protein
MENLFLRDHENNYIFTREARQVYEEIPAQYRPLFWEHFLSEREISPGEIIRFWMMEEPLYQVGITTFVQEPEYEDLDDPDMILANLHLLLAYPAFVWYQGVYCLIPYNFERITYFTSQSESSGVDQEQWGQMWSLIHQAERETGILLGVGSAQESLED